MTFTNKSNYRNRSTSRSSPNDTMMSEASRNHSRISPNDTMMSEPRKMVLIEFDNIKTTTKEFVVNNNPDEAFVIFRATSKVPSKVHETTKHSH
jgi:hypothetical protein